ncbi:hypothetical protein V7S43_007173 [Phytophthora oleae]|uniref:Uncharacterized protein n=1 Tax=Phytophthora oleae TaxID=2107226 RepID=A0ABD3FMS3_9STRA
MWWSGGSSPAGLEASNPRPNIPSNTVAAYPGPSRLVSVASPKSWPESSTSPMCKTSSDTIPATDGELKTDPLARYVDDALWL